MPEIPDNDVEKYLRPLQARMMRHAFGEHGNLDPRSAMIVLKNGLFAEPVANPIPDDVIQVLENPKHSQRWPYSEGPLFVWRDGAKRVAVDLTTFFLNPDSRVRRAALDEFDRQNASHEQFVSPDTFRLINECRADLIADKQNESLEASIVVTDALRDDYFFQIEGVRQCAALRLDHDLRQFLRRVLRPAEPSFQFLLKLPVWGPSRQRAEIERLVEHLTDAAESAQGLMADYFRLFGHLPLTGPASAGAVVAKWMAKHGSTDDLWSAIWAWARSNGSPLGLYHACQVLISNSRLIASHLNRDLAAALCEVVEGVQRNPCWRRRQSVARHYCRFLESLSPGGDGERIAAFAWWLAEYLCSTLDPIRGEVLSICLQVIDECGTQSEEVWKLCRPPVTLSPLRYCTHFASSTWAASIVGEVANSEFAIDLCRDHLPLKKALLKQLPTLSPVCGTCWPSSEAYFAFERPIPVLVRKALSWSEEGSVADELRELSSFFATFGDSFDISANMKRLPAANPLEKGCAD
jgi:hypothetical protein